MARMMGNPDQVLLQGRIAYGKGTDGKFYPLQAIPQYVGVAAGTATTVGVPAGSEYWASDTNITYKTANGTTWILYHTGT